jgi:protocatechuate 3,4-dioxygenase beta subunit
MATNSTEREPQIEYQPYEDATQILRQIPRYPRSFTRTPAQPLIRRPLTLSEKTGPIHAADLLAESGRDLSRPVADAPRAMGQLIHVAGRVADEDGAPLAGAVIELWQANAAGKYIHDMDRHEAPVDPNFAGWGRLVTGPEGEYDFITIKPGAYPVGESDWWWRPPHIHFSIVGTSWMQRYITQMFFPGEPLNEVDLLLNGIPDPEARQRVIFQLQPTTVGIPNLLRYRQDFVMRGKRATPSLD